MVLRQRPILELADLAAGFIELHTQLLGDIVPGLGALVGFRHASGLTEDRLGQGAHTLFALKQSPEAWIDSLECIDELAH